MPDTVCMIFLKCYICQLVNEMNIISTVVYLVVTATDGHRLVQLRN